MANLHIIIGEDDFLVAATAKKIIGESSSGLEVIDSNNSTNEELQLADLREADASFSTPPFLEPTKVTWWKNVKFLPSSGKSASSEVVKSALEKFAEKLSRINLPENQKFILSGPHLLMTSIFAKTLKGVAEIAVFGGGRPWEAQKNAVVRAIDFAQDVGFKFAPGVAERFVAIVGADTRSIMSEVGKLRDYLGEGKDVATADDVMDVTSQGVGVEPALWDVTDALGERNAEKLVSAMRKFEKENGFAVLMTTVVEKFLRQLCEMKDASAHGKLDVVTAGMSPYAARKNEGFLRNWTLRELRIARYRFMRLREKAVSSSGAVDTLLVTELLRAIKK